jgi:hypothetical protein
MANFWRKLAVAVIGVANVGSSVGWDDGVPEGASEGIEEGSCDGNDVKLGPAVGMDVGMRDIVGTVDGFML